MSVPLAAERKVTSKSSPYLHPARTPTIHAMRNLQVRQTPGRVMGVPSTQSLVFVSPLPPSLPLSLSIPSSSPETVACMMGLPDCRAGIAGSHISPGKFSQNYPTSWHIPRLALASETRPHQSDDWQGTRQVYQPQRLGFSSLQLGS